MGHRLLRSAVPAPRLLLACHRVHLSYVDSILIARGGAFKVTLPYAYRARAPRLDQHGHDVLPGGTGGGVCAARQARGLQHRSGKPVHQPGVHRGTQELRRGHQHGRARCLAATTSSSRGCGARSSTRRSICVPASRSATRGSGWHATSSSTTPAGRTPRLAPRPRMSSTSQRCRRINRQLDGPDSTYRTPIPCSHERGHLSRAVALRE